MTGNLPANKDIVSSEQIAMMIFTSSHRAKIVIDLTLTICVYVYPNDILAAVMVIIEDPVWKWSSLTNCWNMT